MYFRVLLEKGHVGAGKSLERTYYSAASDITALFSAAATLPGVKGKSRGMGVKLIERISREEFLLGRHRHAGSGV